ncbi:protein mono-ADP-ribosyltransferase PARP14-like isoform X1 [Epinephelus fuscoguttatus]|uniref:protein mono-ADP-ribosyltransferase PARP14-like isoform X1 n=1 Tax=Epinephelus fuscoguttatus TaxID=293821 RepID=UPI0020D09EF2|nr:protein mono-ADP-ribosyltransferase PARP14-like isoform X1 [Epinephelus fuscoguttatus]
MDDLYKYPIFFECPSLDGEQRKRIEKYFNIRRKSGGGDCSLVTVIHDGVHSIAFREQDAQQRVLQRSKHVLELAGGPLVLTVRGSPGSATCSPITTSTTNKTVSPKLDITPSQQKQQSIVSSSSLPTSGEEYELQLNAYLLRYLKECPKAGRKLEEELASVSCSAQLYPEEEKVLVSRLAQPGAADEDSNWKAEVDKLFDGYLCHYELDSHKVKALLQSCSSPQTTDEVKVYSEVGMAVVVGERSQVNARLVEVGGMRVKRGSSLSEKQTSVRRLGEAKLRLLWKEIEHSLGQDFPGLKITQGAAGQLVLEGSVEEILKAGEWISDQESLVLERTVPDMSPHYLAFLRKAYGGPGVLGDFLGVGDKVEIELRDTELRFFSLSANKLDDTEKKLHEIFNEVKIDVPNCSAVPSELREKLKSKTKEINQGQYRAQVVFGSDSTVCLLGHTKEVEELSEVVIQFILDQSSIEGKVILPYPELVQLLPELLQLHTFDYSGITCHPLTSSSGPMVVLEGPSGKVTEVRNRLGPLLNSLAQDKVTIDLPGAVRYFESSSGKENILSVAHSQKCLVQLQEQPYATRQILASGAQLIKGGTTVASYSLRDGFQVLVCHGDITKLEADALVNAANEDLDHGGGVAAALSKAGGPQVQRESRAIIKQTGKIPTGDVVVTTGGNLNCKKLLHAVGPVGRKSGGKERMLLEKTVQSALNLAEMMEFRSIAMPCISSGVFGVPVIVCSEAIVTAVKKFGSQGGRSLRKIILIDNRQDVVRAMQEACDRFLQGMSTGNSAPSNLGSQMGAAAQDTSRGATAGAPEYGVHVAIIQGTIETQQVDSLVSPMVGHDPLSTRVGNYLANMVGPQMTAKFHKEAGGATLPGDTVLVKGLPVLQAKGVFFLNLLPWDNNQHGTAVQVLRQGIRKILNSCQIIGYSSVALPVLGTGAALRFPHSVASRVALEEVQEFEKSRVHTTSFLVRIVIHPNDKESSKAFQSVQESLHLRGFTNDANPDQASFYRHVSLTNDEVTAMLGEVKLQMVRGDIIHETTDAIINTTDFSSNQSGVSKAILTAAGPTVQADLARVGLPADLMCTTGPGQLGCREIIHASFKSDPQIIRNNCKKILKQCESKGYHSAAFPAINTGIGGMDSVKACKAMLDGMTSAITDLKPNSLKLIRIVIIQQPIFQAFRSELENRFGQPATRHLSLRDKAKQKLKKWHDKHSKTSTASAPQGKTLISSKPPPAVINLIGCGSDSIRTFKRDLEGILQKQLVERELDVRDFSRLDAMELEAVQAKVKILGVSLEHRRRQSSEGVSGNRAGNTARAEGRDRAGSGRDVYVLRGLKEDVLSIIELVHKSIQKALCEDLQDKEEAMLALSVQWSIQDVNKAWHELSLHDNYILEVAYQKKAVSVEMTAPDGMMVTVNLRAQEATNQLSGITYKVKRSESESTLELPTQWEPMHGEVFKKVELQPNSPEYQTVAQGFVKTAKYNIQKIERVQNVYLWHAYTVCRQRIYAKNGPAELGEKSLYHGTSAEACSCIEKDRFDRSYAGAHAAAFGKGVYFAVNAEYSARGFSPADASGLKRLYVARVLTGRYTVGKSSMKATPPRGSDPTDCFDSLVNNQQQPTIFVIFHDDQAYPEYLITFK